MQNESQNITAVKDNKSSPPTMCYKPSMAINALFNSNKKSETFVRCTFYLAVCNYVKYIEQNNDQMMYILEGNCRNSKELLDEIKDIAEQVHHSQENEPKDKPWNKNRISGKLFLQEAANNLDSILKYYNFIFSNYLLIWSSEASAKDAEAKIDRQLVNYTKKSVLIEKTTSQEEAIGSKFLRLMLFEAIFSNKIDYCDIPQKIIDFLGFKHQPLNSVKISLEDLPYDKLFCLCITSNQLSLTDFFTLIENCDDIIKWNCIDSKSWLPTFSTYASEYLKKELGTPINPDTLKSIYYFFENKTKESSLLSFSILLEIWEYVGKELVDYISQYSNTTPQIIRELYTEWGRINPHS